MTLRSMWRFLREARIMSPSLSLAAFDRFFYSNACNRFNLRFDFNDLRRAVADLKTDHFAQNPRKLDVLKKLDAYLRNREVVLRLPRLDYGAAFSDSLEAARLQQLAQLEEDQASRTVKEQTAQMQVPAFNEHGQSNPIQFRNFIDGLIRAVCIRENMRFASIGEVLEKRYVKFRFEQLGRGKQSLLGKTYAHDEEERLRGFVMDNDVEGMPALRELFCRHPASRVSSFSPADADSRVSNVGQLRKLLKVAGMLQSRQDELKFLSVVERHFDPDSSYMESYLKRIELQKHLPRTQSLDLGGVSMLGESMELDQSQNRTPKHGDMYDGGDQKYLSSVVSPVAKPLEAAQNQKFDYDLIEEEDSHFSAKKRAAAIKKAADLDTSHQLELPLADETQQADEYANNCAAIDQSRLLTSLMGHELLYFEWLQNLLLYLVVTVAQSDRRTD